MPRHLDRCSGRSLARIAGAAVGAWFAALARAERGLAADTGDQDTSARRGGPEAANPRGGQMVVGGGVKQCGPGGGVEFRCVDHVLDVPPGYLPAPATTREAPLALEGARWRSIAWTGDQIEAALASGVVDKSIDHSFALGKSHGLMPVDVHAAADLGELGGGQVLDEIGADAGVNLPRGFGEVIS